MARKTVEVGTLLHRLNYFLANDKGTADEREIMISFVEGILHDTGNYMGFRYIEGPDGEVDGLGTRRYYFVGPKIQEDYDAAAALIEKHYYGRGVWYA
jgi:hypothetical protein